MFDLPIGMCVMHSFFTINDIKITRECSKMLYRYYSPIGWAGGNIISLTNGVGGTGGYDGGIGTKIFRKTFPVISGHTTIKGIV